MTEENSTEKWIRVVGLCAIGFLLMVTYAIARPATKSLFLQEYGSRNLPYAWIAVAFFVVLAVSYYNRWVVRFPLMRMFGGSIVITSSLMLVFLAAALLGSKPAVFALYVWKDIYIVIMVEIFWSFANVVFPIKTARWAYGLFCMMGSLGGLVGHLGVGPLSHRVETIHTLWFVLPLFAMIWGITHYFSSHVGETTATLSEHKTASLREGFQVVRKSRYLVLLLLLVAVVQIVVTLIDFQYSRSLELTYTSTNQRTAIIGQVFAMINMVSIVLELLTGPILRFVGVPLALLSIPLMLGAAIGGLLVWPKFLMVVVAKVTSKGTTYSIFKAAKEILYIPLSYKEKTQGKAVVDMLTYRLAKGVASVMLLALAAFHTFPVTGLEGVFEIESLVQVFRVLQESPLLILTILGLTVVWFGLTLAIVRRYRQSVSREQEFSSQ
ncbi:MAG: hypothetical protein EP343_02535 [Deltaproteobacteria bacterium]|nr:MAG: hypothetical protein EP343_02535 [Deltaproteobacteria bacterium]